MSSARRPPGRPGAPAPERKQAAAKGPVVTPQVLGILFGIILVVGLIAFYQGVVVKFSNSLKNLGTQKASTQTEIATYTKKSGRLEEAKSLNIALRKKLSNLDYMFLVDQDSVLDFFDTVFFPIIEASPLGRRGGGKIECDPFIYQINMAMNPFDTIPSGYFEKPENTFKMKYIGEQGGAPTEQPLNTQPTEFLKPFKITMKEFSGTYQELEKFIRDLQTKKDNKVMTVHCFKNDKGKNAGVFRTVTQWTLVISVYFMNPDSAATGDDPPGLPGTATC